MGVGEAKSQAFLQTFTQVAIGIDKHVDNN